MAPYGRILNGDETDQEGRGTPGILGPRTEQFALGSLYYLINYGLEDYGDRCLTEDPQDHEPKVVDFLQDMEFPKLNGDPLIDYIIDKCWRNKYATVAELAARTPRGFLVREPTWRGQRRRAPMANQYSISVTGRIVRGLWCSLDNWRTLKATNSDLVNGREPDGDSHDKLDQDHPVGEFLSKKAFCQDLEKRGLLHLLCSGEPEQLGFTFDWYRHTT